MRAIQRIAKNTAVLTSAEAINKILSLVLYIAIANYLKAAGYGQFSFIMALLAFFQVLANFGLDKLIIREVAKKKEYTTNYARSMVRIRIFLSLLAYAALTLFIHLTGKSPEVIYGAHLIGLSMIFIAMSNVYLSIFNAHEKLEINGALLILIKLLILSLVFLAIYLEYSLLFILGAFVVGEFIRLIVSWIIYHEIFHPEKIRKSINLPIKKVLYTAIPFVVVGIAALIHMRVDVIMLSLMKGDQSVGWYSAAFVLVLGLMFIPRSYTLSIFPVISRYAKDSDRLLGLSWQKSIKFLLIVSLPIAIGVFLLADKFIDLFYQSGYKNSTVALQVLMVAIPWIFINSINMYLLYATDRQKQATNMVLISCGVNILLNFLFIPKFSYLGASWATVITEALNALLFFGFIFFALNLKINIFKILPKPLVASLLMGVLIYKLYDLNLILLISLSVIVYIGLLVFLRTFDDQDKYILSKMLPFASKYIKN